MFCTGVRNKAAIGDVVEGKKKGWRADDEKFLYGEEADAVWAGFGQVSESETQCFDWTKVGESNGWRGTAGEVALQRAPIGKDNPHHVFDLIALMNSATQMLPYTTAATIASVLLGRYPVDSSAVHPRRER